MCVCIPRHRWLSSPFSEQSVCGPTSHSTRSLSGAPTNGIDFGWPCVLPVQLDESCRPGPGLGGTWAPGGQLPLARVACCQAEWPVFLPSQNLWIRVLPEAAMPQRQLWVFIYSCVCSQSLCRCQRVYGLLKFPSLRFDGRCLLQRSAVWGKDR